MRFRVATEGDVDCVAEIVHGSPGQESIALLGGEQRARRFGFAVTRLQSRSTAWPRTLLAEVSGRTVGVLQWRPGAEPVLPMSLQLAWTTIRVLGPIAAAGAWRRAQIRRRVEPSPPPEAFHVEELHVLPDLRGRGIRRATRGIAWFRDSATECLSRMHRVKDLLEAKGYQGTMLCEMRVGHIVYEDDLQVVAEPFSDTRTGGQARAGAKTRARLSAHRIDWRRGNGLSRDRSPSGQPPAPSPFF